MKLAWITLLCTSVVGCDAVEAVDDASESSCAKCDTPTPLPDGCAVVRTSGGPRGTLVDYAITRTDTQWLLTSDQDGYSTLWEREGEGAWQLHELDRSCRYGVLALDREERAALACGVQSATYPRDNDVELYTTDSQEPWQRAYSAMSGGGWQSNPDSTGGDPLSLVFDEQNRPHIVVGHTTNGSERSSYLLASRVGGTWSSRRLWNETSGAQHDRNHRVLARDGELYFAFKAGGKANVELKRIRPGDADAVVTVHGTDARASGFGDDFELIPDPSDATAWHVVTTDSSTIYRDLIEPGYVAYERVVGDSAGRRSYVDGPLPIHDRRAGVAGASAALRPDGRLLVSYDAYGQEALRVAYRDGNAWVRTDLWFDGEVGNNVLRLDRSGHMHIAVENRTTGSIEMREERCQ